MAWIIVPLLAALAAAAVTVALAVRRGLFRLRSDVDDAWRAFAEQLEKRQAHVTAMTTLCSRLMRYEQEALDRVTETGRIAQAASARRDLPALAGAEKTQHAAVAVLLELAGNYPQFAKSRAFAALEERLATLDGRVARRREQYNEAVSLLNLRCAVFPSRLVAAFSGCRRAEFLVQA